MTINFPDVPKENWSWEVIEYLKVGSINSVKLRVDNIGK